MFLAHHTWRSISLLSWEGCAVRHGEGGAVNVSTAAVSETVETRETSAVLLWLDSGLVSLASSDLPPHRHELRLVSRPRHREALLLPLTSACQSLAYSRAAFSCAVRQATCRLIVQSMPHCT